MTTQTLKRLILVKTNNVYDLLTHIGVIVLFSTVLFLWFFISFLPWFTNFGQTVTVPNVVGMNMEEMKKFLYNRDLRFVVKDSSYSRDYKPFSVLSQSPEPGAKVKQGRKIYVIVSPRVAPKVQMPKLVDMPFESAKMTLRNMDLDVGRVKYVPFIGQNVVLEQKYKGKEIDPGMMIHKGSKVDLVIGDGIGQEEFSVPNLQGLTLDEAELTIKGSDLVLGQIFYDYNSHVEIGKVVKQSPTVRAGVLKKGVKPNTGEDDRPKNTIRAGEIIDLWISGNPIPKPEKKEEEEEDIEKEYDNINIRKAEDIEQLNQKRKGLNQESKPDN